VINYRGDNTGVIRMDEKFCPYCDNKATECRCGMVKIIEGLFDEAYYSGIICAKRE